MRYNFFKKERGAALLLVFLILVAVLAIALGVSGLLLTEVKMSREVPKSLRAYYVAEVGIERKLFEIRADPPNSNDIGSGPGWCTGSGKQCLDSDTCYAVDVIPGGTGTCPAAMLYCIKSYGCYKSVRRAIEVSY